MKAIIVGGGIGGLTLALALQARGLSAQVFEKAPYVREVGLGVETHPHAIKALAELGLLAAVEAAGRRIDRLICKTAQGQEIRRQPRGVAAGHEHPHLSLHRGKLQRLLYEAVIERLGPDAIHTGSEISAFAQTRRGVAATFQRRASGVVDTLTGDVLVGADGMRSTVRRALHGEEGQLRCAGARIWRGAAWARPVLCGRTMIDADGTDAKMVVAPIFSDPRRPHEVLLNWVARTRLGPDDDASPPTDDGWLVEAALDDVTPHVDGVFNLEEVDVAALIRATPVCYVSLVVACDPLSKWGQGRATLLGDAAHPTSPMGSNGASQAILDAMRLAEALEGAAGADASIETALAAYEADRRPATSAIMTADREHGRGKAVEAPRAAGVLRRARDRRRPTVA